MWALWKILIPAGSLCIALGIFIASINTMAVDLILQDNMVLTPSSKSYPMWKDLPVPLLAKFYLFEVTNSEDVLKKGAKPNVAERGPYVFQEFHHKFDEVWNAGNGTVTYKQKKYWVHQSGDLEESITILNVPFAAVGKT